MHVMNTICPPNGNLPDTDVLAKVLPECRVIEGLDLVSNQLHVKGGRMYGRAQPSPSSQQNTGPACIMALAATKLGATHLVHAPRDCDHAHQRQGGSIGNGDAARIPDRRKVCIAIIIDDDELHLFREVVFLGEGMQVLDEVGQPEVLAHHVLVVGGQNQAQIGPVPVCRHQESLDPM